MSKLNGVMALLTMLLAWHPSAQAADDFYEGKQIDFIIGGDAGSSYDTWARLLGRYFTQYLPGHPTVVVRNMPGAGYILAANHLYQRASRDGLSIGMFTEQMPLAAALKSQPNLYIDFSKTFFIGSPDHSTQICVARGDARVKSAGDLATQEMIVGGIGAGSAVSFLPNFTNAVLGWNFEIIEGYKSTQEVMLAVERGELEGLCQSYETLKRTHIKDLKNGALRLLFTIDAHAPPGTDIPSLSEFAMTDEQQQLIALKQTSDVGRPIVAPPGTPAARVADLRKAFDQMIQDPQFLAEARKLQLDPSPTSGLALEQKYKAILETPPKIAERAAALMRELLK